MPGEDKSLKLSIELEKTGTGGTTASAELNSVKDAASGAKGATEDLTLATQKGGAATDDFTKETKKASEATEEHTGKTRAAFLLFSEINKIMPGLGHEIHAAFAGPLGPLILLTIGIAEIHEKIKAFNEDLDKQAAAAAEPTFLNAIQARIEVLNAAAAAQQSYVDAISNIKTSEEGLGTQLKDQLELYKALERARAGLTSAQKELDIAKVQQGEAGGQITPEQAAEQRAAIEKKYLEKAQQDHEQSQDNELKARQDKLKQAAELQKQLETDRVAAAARLEADESHRASVKIDPAQIIQQLAAAEAERSAIEKRQAAALDHDYYKLPDDQISSQQRDYRRLVNSWSEGSDSKIKLLQQQLNQYGETQTPAAATKLQAEKDALEKATADAKTNEKFQTDLREAINNLTSTIAATRPIERATVSTREQAASATDSVRVDTQVKKDIETIQRAAANTHPSAEVADEAVRALADIKSGFKNYHGAVVGKMRELHTNINDLVREVETLQSQQKLARSTGTGG